MLKNISKLQCKVGEKDYNLLCDNDSPLEHVKEAILQFLKYVQLVEDQVKEQIEAQKSATEQSVEIEEVKPAE